MRLLPVFVLPLSTSGCLYHRIGDLNMVATRNVSLDQDYELLEPYQVAKVKSSGGALEKAIDKVVKKTPGGEFAMNVKIFVKGNGRRVKVEADVWGLPGNASQDDGTGMAKGDFAVGDRVSWKSPTGMQTGEIVGLNDSAAVILVDAPDGWIGGAIVSDDRKVSRPFGKLTKLGSD